jgi:hypothetical protein
MGEVCPYCGAGIMSKEVMKEVITKEALIERFLYILYHIYHFWCEFDLKKKWVDFLSQFLWTHWVTLTFRDDISSFVAIKRFKKFFKNFSYFVVAELHKIRGFAHLHALVNLMPCENNYLIYKERWDKEYGWSKWQRYCKKGGASYYITKYVIKNIVDWDINIEKNLFLTNNVI